MITTGFQLSLGTQARVEATQDMKLRVSARGRDFTMRAPLPAVTSAIARLTEGGATEDALCEEILRSGGDSALLLFMGLLRALDAHGMLDRRIMVDGRPFATLSPSATGFHFESTEWVAEGPRKLSRFAYVRAADGVPKIESPLGRAKVELNDARAVAVTLALARPNSLQELTTLFPELGADTIAALLTLLHNAATLADADDPERANGTISSGSSAAWWEFHDLLFHMRSRRGRHDAAYGGTYPHQPIVPPPLARPRPTNCYTVPLARPDLDELRRTDTPFTEILERRRSIRTYGREPLSSEQLGEFLYRSARYQLVVPGGATDYALRPAPAGGALHELEIYPVVAQCSGLPRGVYHYRPLEHELELIASPSTAFERLLDEAWWTATRESPLNVCFLFTARSQRVFWKYESMAYALILKNLGALYATMYLVATAMGLAPSALGGGDSELFATATGIDPYAEPAVGEFVLGSRGDS